jgi:hypothetical protein
MNFAAATFRLSAGILVWALHFGLIYGVTGLACARGMPRAAPWGIGAATLVAVLVLVPLVVAGWRRRAEFESAIGGALGAFALLAVLWQALPVLLIEACA